MELLGYFLFLVVISVIWNGVVSGGKAALKTATGPGTLKENLDLQFSGMGSFELRLVTGRIGENADGPMNYKVEVRGFFPIERTTEIGFVTSVLDVTDGEPKPVISNVDMVQEPQSIAFQNVQRAGVAAPNQGYPHWTRVGMVVPEWLQPARSGRRRLRILTRMVDWANPPAITNGFSDPSEQALVLWVGAEEVQYDAERPGWEERAERREEAQGLAVQIGVAVAMSDGELHDSEGAILRRWIQRTISFYTGDERERLKGVYNSSLRNSYNRAMNGDLSLSSLLDRLNEIGETTDKYDTVELCFDIMAADGVADKDELTLIRKLTEALSLDLAEVAKMRDQRLVELDVTLSEQAGVDEILGIAPEWDDETKRKFVREEFKKWNNRLNTLPEGEGRENAQRMLNLLADYRVKLSA